MVYIFISNSNSLLRSVYRFSHKPMAVVLLLQQPLNCSLPSMMLDYAKKLPTHQEDSIPSTSTTTSPSQEDLTTKLNCTNQVQWPTSIDDDDDNFNSQLSGSLVVLYITCTVLIIAVVYLLFRIRLLDKQRRIDGLNPRVYYSTMSSSSTSDVGDVLRPTSLRTDDHVQLSCDF